MAAPSRDAGAALLEQQTLTGDWSGARSKLAEKGFRPFLNYTGILWANLAGGREVDAEVNGYLNFGIDLDLAALGAWDGFEFYIDFNWWQGPEPTNTLIGGQLAQALSAWEAAHTFRVFSIYLQQSFDERRWLIKLGQIGADSDFMLSRYGAVFLNAAFGDLASQNMNIDAPIYPLAAPGLFASGTPLTWLTGRFGAYTGDPGDDVSSNHGFDWKIGNNAGYAFFAELAATPEAVTPPGTYTLGAIYDTSGSAQFGTAAEDRAKYELYLMIDQALIADDYDNPFVGAFARITGSPGDSLNVVDIYGDAGIAVYGLLPSRPKDVVGTAISIMRYTDDFQQQQQAAGTPVGGGETVLEVTYQINIAPWLILQPDLQFFFNPSFSRRDSVSLGGDFVATF